jgi:hypothetical protein
MPKHLSASERKSCDDISCEKAKKHIFLSGRTACMFLRVLPSARHAMARKSAWLVDPFTGRVEKLTVFERVKHQLADGGSLLVPI